MSGPAELFLGVIALSVLVMALIQVGALVAGFRLARRIEELSRQVDREFKPLIANLTAVTAEAARTAALASRQVERVDRVFGDLASRLDETLATAQRFVRGPARNGMAILTGVQAALAAFRGIRESSRRRRKLHTAGDDEESLFIG